jgi:hypothetical protein
MYMYLGAEALQLAKALGVNGIPYLHRSTAPHRESCMQSCLISFLGRYPEILPMLSGCLRLVNLFPLPKLRVKQLL